MEPISEEWIGYIRVSTEDQADHGVSLDAQRDKVRRFADLHGLPMARIVEDAGLSAKTLERPGMREVIGFLEMGGTGLLIAKLDRLTRSLRDWTELVETFFSLPAGPRLLSASEAIETRTANGRLVLNILMAVAQAERETIVERTGTAMDHKRSKGERLGTIPFGKMLGPDGKTLVPCQDEGLALLHMNLLRQQRWSLRAIANELDSLGYRPRSGRKWALSTISQLLKESQTG